MTYVAGVDGTPGGWAVVTKKDHQLHVDRIDSLTALFGARDAFDIVAVDIPIGLLDSYQPGGRQCDRAARTILGRPRSSSVFSAPIRPVLSSVSWEEACHRSRASASEGKAISKQTFAILPKIKEADELLQVHPELREVVREVHPEVCFAELVGRPLAHPKSSSSGRKQRKDALAGPFPQLAEIEQYGRQLKLPLEDILDAAVACWSALRIAEGQGRRVPSVPPLDSTGLSMAIWI